MEEEHTIVRFEDVWYHYPRTKAWSLKEITLSIKKGEFIAVIGENGAGKTTFCKCLNGIIPHTERGLLKGRVITSGLDTKTAYTSELALHVGIVLEDPDTQLFTTTVLNEVAFGPENLRQDPKEIRETARWALGVVGLEGFEDRPPTALSGGQKQRVAIASVLSMRPEIIVLDEPTSQLDPLGTEEVFEVVSQLRSRYGMTIIMSSHKMEEIVRFADRILVLHHGEVAAFDTPEQVFRNEELFSEVQVAIPSTVELAGYLQKRNVPVSLFSSVEEGESEIRRCLRGAGERS
ncbi:energy-coupling factor ABC transporter ATP-binding protein [Sediminispirochaeta smaragdinae]|jgi:energy-coupling factor transporter ATP-binding protein EcfA2|uniref:ABC transporter related protein n=1 Tax=Sediminispirochaeta smaragdinae (strain DSM 11293 / JCM 15392 / SEBR 4228) TaxID=573413 RepID=E1R258_SEDSS|nr:ATP-binding cassette domain-containing protein [Sediminispirochaeta smaragdinae]ADK81943.1 ABC transporter related protein [Sediminispirochaeta smaragdinae DSM 11293]